MIRRQYQGNYFGAVYLINCIYSWLKESLKKLFRLERFKPEFLFIVFFRLTAMIIHLLILSSAVQMNEFSYIHFHIGLLLTKRNHYFNDSIEKIRFLVIHIDTKSRRELRLKQCNLRIVKLFLSKPG